MDTNDNLLELVGSLSKSEFRYLKLFSSLQSGNKNYLKLLYELKKQADKGEAYDKKAIREKFHGEKFIKQLTFTRNYLFSQILKSLLLYNSENSIDLKISSMTNHARLLYNKALFRQFFRLVEKAKKLCLRHERFASYLQLLEMEKVVIIKKIFPGKDAEKLFEEETDILNKLRNLMEYHHLVSRLTSLFMLKGRAREGSTIRLIENLKESYVMMRPSRAQSVIALERYYFIHQLTADLQGDFKTMYKYARKRFDLMLENPYPFEGQMFNYRQDIIMYMILLTPKMEAGSPERDHHVRPDLLKLLKEHTGSTEIERINLFLIESALELMFPEKYESFPAAWETISGIIEDLEKYRGKLDANFEILIYYAIVKVCVNFDEFNNANRYLNILLNLPQISVRKDIEIYARMLNLVVHYELGNYDLLEYLVRSTYRFLINSKNVYGFEKAVISFLRKLPGIKSDALLAENLGLLKNEMLSLKENSLEKNAMLYFNFPAWIDKKITSLKTK